jgi:hypothetical protein
MRPHRSSTSEHPSPIAGPFPGTRNPGSIAPPFIADDEGAFATNSFVRTSNFLFHVFDFLHFQNFSSEASLLRQTFTYANEQFTTAMSPPVFARSVVHPPPVYVVVHSQPDIYARYILACDTLDAALVLECTQDMVHDKDIAILVMTPCGPGRLEARVLCHLFQAEDAVDCLDHLGFTDIASVVSLSADDLLVCTRLSAGTVLLLGNSKVGQWSLQPCFVISCSLLPRLWIMLPI